MTSAEATPAPMRATSGRWSIAFEGFLYNAVALRDELQRQGHACHVATDAEIVISAFATWGAQSPRRLQGMFAFALYDRQAQTLYLVRDPFGTKSLYYSIHEGHVLYASALPTLMRACQTRRLNKRAVLEWLLYRHLGSQETLLHDLYSVAPGMIVTIRRGQVEAQVYAFPADYIDAGLYQSFKVAPQPMVVAAAAEALTQSVQDCLCDGAPVGTLCSGGVDSTLITALASQQVEHLLAIHAATLDANAFDERRYAEGVTAALGVRLICTPIDRQIFAHMLPRVIFFNGMPLPHIHVVAFFLTIQAAHAQGIRVLLTGDAADDHFGGLWYRHRRQRLLLRLKDLFGRLPRRLRNAIALTAGLHGGMPCTFIGYEGVIPSVLSAIDGYARAETRSRLEQAYGFVKDARCRSLLVTMAEDLTERWDLERADHLGMAVGVQCRAPFVHPTVVRLALNLPVAYRFRRFTDKWLLKQLAARFVPRQFVYCQKRPWDLPWRQYLAPFAREQLFRGGFCSEVLGLSTWALHDIVESWDSHIEVLWNLINLELWGRLFVLGDPLEKVGTFIANTCRA